MKQRSRHAVRGFTLVEAMVSITIMVILMAFAVPSFQAASLNSQLRATASDLVASAYLARGEALKRNAVVTLCMSSNGTSCATSGGWEQGWIVRSGTTLKVQAAAPAGIRISAGGVTGLSFQPTAAGATAAAFTVCRQTPQSGMRSA